MTDSKDGWPRLTSLCSLTGASSKLRADVLSRVLEKLPAVSSKALVAHGDATIFKASKTTAWVQAVAMVTPMVDEPSVFGKAVVAHALSQIWAVGATPLLAVNVLSMPRDTPPGLVGAVLAGAQAHAQEAGVMLAGGHTQQAAELVYGVAVVGQASPSELTLNEGAEAGDALVLTKPIGTGIAGLALKRGVASPLLVDRLTKQLTAFNEPAARVLTGKAGKANACTDVGGFGLLGSALKLAKASGLAAMLELERIPILPAVPSLADQGVVPFGSKANLASFDSVTRYPAGLPEAVKLVLNDAQTNGGFLGAVPVKALEKTLAALRKAGVEAYQIGVMKKGPASVSVVSD